MKAILLAFAFILSSCTSNQVVGLKGFETRQSEEYYQNSGVIQYFLSELPAWANSYPDGNCQRQTSVRYLNMKSLRDSYRYSYSDALQFQLLYNQMSVEKARGSGFDKMRPQDEELIFFEASNRIQSGFYPFRRPDFERVSLIWIDPLLSTPKRILSLLERADITQGHPVVVSNCLASHELSDWLKKNGVANENIRLISSEMFSPYDVDAAIKAEIHIDVEKFFTASQKIFFYVPKDNVPSSIQGKFTYKFY